MQITQHFSETEFTCTCGCGKNNIKHDFVKRLEKLYELLDSAIGIKAIYVNSGCRCKEKSVEVGGYPDDAHVQGFAADIHVVRKDGISVSAFDVAEAAEILGFQGIGIITAVDCHIDDRGIYPYKNNHWYGHEQTGVNYTTFAGRGEYTKELHAVGQADAKEQKPIKITFDGKNYEGYITEV